MKRTASHRVVAGTALIAPCASTHSPLMRTIHVPVRALPFQPSGRNPMSLPEMIIPGSRRVCADTRMPVITKDTTHNRTTVIR